MANYIDSLILIIAGLYGFYVGYKKKFRTDWSDSKINKMCLFLKICGVLLVLFGIGKIIFTLSSNVG